jgi:hypothetical protein
MTLWAIFQACRYHEKLALRSFQLVRFVHHVDLYHASGHNALLAQMTQHPPIMPVATGSGIVRGV